jgi:hypothetical protein
MKVIRPVVWDIDLAQRDGSMSACRQASRYALLDRLVLGSKRVLSGQVGQVP